jgi:hypothetical protein
VIELVCSRSWQLKDNGNAACIVGYAGSPSREICWYNAHQPQQFPKTNCRVFGRIPTILSKFPSSGSTFNPGMPESLLEESLQLRGFQRSHTVALEYSAARRSISMVGASVYITICLGLSSIQLRQTVGMFSQLSREFRAPSLFFVVKAKPSIKAV